ncbi:MAG TPA: OmpA family protein [Kofleriaceae bacterium]|jgi:outer membrane protein OmpA-like peptidoglycan-associated protein
MRYLLLAVAVLAAGCAQLGLGGGAKESFDTMNVTATQPPPGPDKVILTPSHIAITDKVQFETGKADLKPASFALLDEVVAVMKSNPQIEVVEIGGHTDSTGSADLNHTLSQQRAESVMKYISSKGIAKNRLTAKGFGPDVPIADNTTDQGREANRRVEFLITKQGPKKTVVKDE